MPFEQYRKYLIGAVPAENNQGNVAPDYASYAWWEYKDIWDHVVDGYGTQNPVSLSEIKTF